MRNKRSRDNGHGTAAGTSAGSVAAGADTEGRRVRVRSRLIIAVAVVGLTVIGAGTPAVLSASADLHESQRLVTLADQGRQTVTLAHALADERDQVTAFVAAGRRAKEKSAVRELGARVDRQISEIASEAGPDLRRDLDRVPAVRTAAVGGKESALAAHRAYSEVIAALLSLADDLAAKTPPRADAALGVSRALDPLGQASEQASATRGLLLAALAVPSGEQLPDVYNPVTGRYEEAGPNREDRTRGELTAAGQRSRVREQAALADFEQSAPPELQENLDATVTGPEVKAAEGFLGKLTDSAELSDSDRELDVEAVAAALTARIDRLRSVESSLSAERATALSQLRDEDVTALEILVVLIGVCLLLAVGVATAVARTLTRPLAVLRLGAGRLAQDPGAEPVRFTGRNDEFADVVRHLNTLNAHAGQMHGRIDGLDADRRALVERNEELMVQLAQRAEELDALRSSLDAHRKVLGTTSVSLSLRTLGLVERQLAVIEQMEAKEQDPDRLATLFKLDHLATVMRRHNENLLVLSGTEHGSGHAGPVPLVDVMRAAISEIERYERVELQSLPPHSQVAGHAADDVSHIVAELLENATTFSPPDARVRLSGWMLDGGEIVLSVTDEGIGVTPDRLQELNERLADPDSFEHEEDAGQQARGLGLYVAARLAARHGARAELRAHHPSGIAASVVVPAALLPTVPPAVPEHAVAAPGAPELHLPGSIAEANSNALPPRQRPDADPVIELAERALAEAGATADPRTAPTEAPQVQPVAHSSEPPAAAGDAAGATDSVPVGYGPSDHAPTAASAADVVVEPRDGAGIEPDAWLIAAPEAVPEPASQAPSEVPATDADVPTWHSAEHTHSAAQDMVEAAPAHGEQENDERTLDLPRPVVTEKGLPKRTPRVVAQAAEPVHSGGSRVDAEELRRRLGGFYQGSRDGRRVVDAELADRAADTNAGPQAAEHARAAGTHTHGHAPARAWGDEGDTVEEART